ncbi:hypothetical protein PVT68_01115 [Microbulbifer bruguierae]|uniref:Uncharacterized protein n=1 Tax=Microbulbifer bruguierae TaxID=3029061 RepID=A0ABY8NEV1_9GAMM|nr:hypothetical protein [Microbulbifer bruguierae]WGL16914.1 hypothetical protein PVT68_01115 [Microbulbifer bruguierae]
MMKLLLPLIILLLIIGYFMSQKSHDAVDDAYDKLEKPGTESMETSPVPEPDVDTTIPPDSDETPMPEEPESTLRDEAREAGDAIKGAVDETGDVIKGAAEDAGDALKDAGEATKDAAEDAMDKLRHEDKTDDEPQ